LPTVNLAQKVPSHKHFLLDNQYIPIPDYESFKSDGHRILPCDKGGIQVTYYGQTNLDKETYFRVFERDVVFLVAHQRKPGGEFIEAWVWTKDFGGQPTEYFGSIEEIKQKYDDGPCDILRIIKSSA